MQESESTELSGNYAFYFAETSSRNHENWDCQYSQCSQRWLMVNTCQVHSILDYHFMNNRICRDACFWNISLGFRIYFAAAAAKSLQSCPTPCDPIDSSPPGSPDPGSLQARTLEWVAISFSNACKLKVKVRSLSRVRVVATPWTAAHQAPPSMGFSKQEYWSGLPL